MDCSIVGPLKLPSVTCGDLFFFFSFWNFSRQSKAPRPNIVSASILSTLIRRTFALWNTHECTMVCKHPHTFIQSPYKSQIRKKTTNSVLIFPVGSIWFSDQCCGFAWRKGGGGGGAVGTLLALNSTKTLNISLIKRKNKVGGDPSARGRNYSESDLVQLNLPKWREFNIWCFWSDSLTLISFSSPLGSVHVHVWQALWGLRAHCAHTKAVSKRRLQCLQYSPWLQQQLFSNKSTVMW